MNETATTTSLELTLIDAEAIAKKVGYARPEKVRALIKRNRTNLLTLGGFPLTRKVSVKGPNGTTREIEDYLLNPRQAVFIAALLPTPAAAVLGAFHADLEELVRDGHLVAAGTPEAKFATDMAHERHVIRKRMFGVPW